MVYALRRSTVGKGIISTILITASVLWVLTSRDILLLPASFMEVRTRFEHYKANFSETDEVSNSELPSGIVPIEAQSNRIQRLPRVIIAGAKKSGTKALLSFLASHPLVKACEHEVHFFDKNWYKGMEWYKKQMPPSHPNQITIEKSPRYLVTPQAPSRIRKALPEIKLLFIFRNPTTRALSDYTHIIARKRKTPWHGGGNKSFESAVFLNRQEGKLNYSNPVISTGRYSLHLYYWMKYFSLHQMHFVDGDRFITEPWVEMVPVQRFLGLPVFVDRKSFVFNESKGFYCLRLRPSGPRGNASMQCLGKNKGRHHPNVPNSVIKILNDYFSPYNKELYKLTGKKFQWIGD